MTKYNKNGGILPEDDEELKRAQNVDLMTFPMNIKGVNCANCKWMRKNGYCANHRVAQHVNERMCCALWTREGEYRPFKQLEKYK